MKPEKIQEHEMLCTELMMKMPDGKWKTEVNRLNWKAHGLDCMIVRQPSSGHLCGYVGVPASHSLYGHDYNNVDVEVHGGLTYGEGCAGFVCHVPEPGDSDLTWWFGFDCMHSGDLSPRDELNHQLAEKGEMPECFRSLRGFGGHDTYKSIEYVKAETERLAKQLAERAA